jgi:hypothetical protein
MLARHAPQRLTSRIAARRVANRRHHHPWRQNGQSSQPEPQHVGSSASRIWGRNGIVTGDGTAGDAEAGDAEAGNGKAGNGKAGGTGAVTAAAAGAPAAASPHLFATALSSARAFSSRAVCSSFTGE